MDQEDKFIIISDHLGNTDLQVTMPAGSLENWLAHILYFMEGNLIHLG